MIFFFILKTLYPLVLEWNNKYFIVIDKLTTNIYHN